MSHRKLFAGDFESLGIQVRDHRLVSEFGPTKQPGLAAQRNGLSGALIGVVV
jgi:hypothetical protein